MISLIIWIILIVLAIGLLAYSLLSNDTVPYSEVVALVVSTLIMWIITVLYATGNVIASTSRKLVSQIAIPISQNTTTTTYTYETVTEYLPINSTVVALLIVGSIALTLYCLYVLIPTIIELVHTGSEN